jgi:hypothetical protein
VRDSFVGADGAISAFGARTWITSVENGTVRLRNVCQILFLFFEIRTECGMAGGGVFD